MGVAVLNDEAQDFFRRLHGDVKPRRCAEVVNVDVARPDREPVQQLRDGLAKGGNEGAGRTSDSPKPGISGAIR